MSNQETVQQDIEKFKEYLRDCRKREDLARKDYQDNCPHVQGGLGPSASQWSALVWHLFDDGIMRGVCTGCLKVFEPGDPLYMRALAAPRQNTVSTACIKSEVVPLTKDVQKEIDSQFCDLDSYGQDFEHQSFEDFVKDELYKRFRQGLIRL